MNAIELVTLRLIEDAHTWQTPVDVYWNLVNGGFTVQSGEVERVLAKLDLAGLIVSTGDPNARFYAKRTEHTEEFATDSTLSASVELEAMELHTLRSMLDKRVLKDAEAGKDATALAGLRDKLANAMIAMAEQI